MAGKPVTTRIQKARAIIAGLTANPDFTTPVPTVVRLSEVTDALEAAENTVRNQGGRVNRELRDIALATFMTEFNSSGNYVQFTSGGDELKILSTGFEVRSAPTPINRQPAPERMSATTNDLNPGEVLARIQGNPKRTHYLFQCRVAEGPKAPEDGWDTPHSTTQPQWLFAGLVSGQLYEFRACVVNAAGQGPWCNAFRLRPQ